MRPAELSFSRSGQGISSWLAGPVNGTKALKAFINETEFSCPQLTARIPHRYPPYYLNDLEELCIYAHTCSNARNTHGSRDLTAVTEPECNSTPPS